VEHPSHSTGAFIRSLFHEIIIASPHLGMRSRCPNHFGRLLRNQNHLFQTTFSPFQSFGGHFSKSHLSCTDPIVSQAALALKVILPASHSFYCLPHKLCRPLIFPISFAIHRKYIQAFDLLSFLSPDLDVHLPSWISTDLNWLCLALWFGQFPQFRPHPSLIFIDLRRFSLTFFELTWHSWTFRFERAPWSTSFGKSVFLNSYECPWKGVRRRPVRGIGAVDEAKCGHQDQKISMRKSRKWYAKLNRENFVYLSRLSIRPIS
jgi:hypothetical protein